MSVNDIAYDFYDSLSAFLEGKNFHNYDLVGCRGDYPMGVSKISIEVEGDWKHDHWLFKDLVNDWVAENGINLFKIDYQEIGESDSDYYTAQYDIFIAPNEDTVSTLNNMSKLFRESLFGGKKSSNSRRFLKESKMNMVPKEFTYTLHIDNSSQDVTSYVVVIPNGLKASDGSTMDAVVYAEDENGNEINFSSIDEAQKWIDTYKDNLSFHVKNRDELHATPIEKEKYDESLTEGVNNRRVYVVEPHKIDMDLYDIVFIDNGKRASSKRFESYEDAVKFIKRNARYNNWIAGNVDESLTEDTIKTKSGKWVNKGKEGTHGEFKTKKEADAQRRAIWVNWNK